MTIEVFWQPSLRKTIVWSSAITIVVASVKVSVHHLGDFIAWFRMSSVSCISLQELQQRFLLQDQ